MQQEIRQGGWTYDNDNLMIRLMATGDDNTLLIRRSAACQSATARSMALRSLAAKTSQFVLRLFWLRTTRNETISTSPSKNRCRSLHTSHQFNKHIPDQRVLPGGHLYSDRWLLLGKHKIFTWPDALPDTNSKSLWTLILSSSTQRFARKGMLLPLHWLSDVSTQK